jgi:hypothetical protein
VRLSAHIGEKPMSDTKKAAPKAGAASAQDVEKRTSLYKELEALSHSKLAEGNPTLHAALHNVVVALAGAKFAASQAEHVAQLPDEAVELLDRVKAL